MSRLTFNSSRGAKARNNKYIREVSHVKSEKMPSTSRSRNMFNHKPYSTDMKGVSDETV